MITVNDNIDTATGEDDFTPFRAIMSEWYARDTSRKIKSSLNSKGRNGKPLTNNPPYGFVKDPNDKYHWLIDEEAAAVVRRIFQMAMDGMGPWMIAQTLCNEKVERPSYYLGQRGLGNKRNSYDIENPYGWRSASVVHILSRMEYIGHTVNFKTNKEHFKDRRSKINAPDKWQIFENTHERIVTAEIFDTVQRLRKTVRRNDTIGEANSLTGLLFCADCNGKLYYKRSRASVEYSHRDQKPRKRGSRNDYECSTYKLANANFGESCSSHFITTAAVHAIILDSIKSVATYAIENEEEFAKKIHEASAIQQVTTAKAHKKLLAKNERRVMELDKFFRRAYEDNINEKLTDERFSQLSADYEGEQLELKVQNETLRLEIETFEQDTMNADSFIDLARKYANFDFEALTNTMINEFIHKIVIHEREVDEYGDKTQQVDVYLNFIGNFVVPTEQKVPTTEELEEQARARKKRIQQRKASRRYHDKKRQEAEWQRSLDAGEITQAEIDAKKQELLLQAEVKREERREKHKQYRREWDKQNRAKKKAAKLAVGTVSTITSGTSEDQEAV
ncbi:MAG: DUF4368 domain-containing protein [Defluviitaleaceae bacterium]|nr:DUF4368 domain-containing protein [Defluviitaleaceae bacterium]